MGPRLGFCLCGNFLVCWQSSFQLQPSWQRDLWFLFSQSHLQKGPLIVYVKVKRLLGKYFRTKYKRLNDVKYDFKLFFFFCSFIIHLFSRSQWIWALSSQIKECLLFALLLFSSAGLSDEYNTPFHLLSVSAPGAVGYAICGLEGWDGMGWMLQC